MDGLGHLRSDSILSIAYIMPTENKRQVEEKEVLIQGGK